MKKRMIALLLAFACVTSMGALSACSIGGSNHTHIYSDEWTFDETYHWHNAECAHMSETKDKAKHTFDNGTETPATFESAGYITYGCTVCDYEKQVEGEAALEHNYSDELTHDNGNTHWYACIDQGYESLKKGETEHVFDDGVYTEATFESAGYTTYTCSCGFTKQIEGEAALEHNYSDTLTHNNGDTHWYACIDEGYESLKKGEEKHNLTESNYDVTTGYATYTCVCGFSKQYLRSAITSLPMVSSTVYVGQKLSDVTLSGGTGSVDGTFAWSAPDTVITASGNYNVTFTPTNTEYAPITGTIAITATQLTVTVNVGDGGSSSQNGVVNVNYNGNLTVMFTPDSGYILQSLTVDGNAVATANSYTFENITANHTISATFEEYAIQSTPTISSTVYIGQKLSDITFTGGNATVAGTFSWTNPDEVITSSGHYGVTFTPADSSYPTLSGTVAITATQLTVTVNVGENGSASETGTVNVNYGSSLSITFTPDNGYTVGSLTVDENAVTAASSYTFENIMASHTISVAFAEQVDVSDLPFTLTYVSGTENAYTYADNVLTFTTITADTVYSISGELEGNIVIDVDTTGTYKFDLEMTGFTLTSDSINPITVLSGNEVSLKAKNGYENYIYDNRATIDSTDTTLYSAAVYSLVDLEMSGKGKLTIVSANNNGIHTKDDLQVKNLTLSVTCVDNALKGNDSVEITSATTTLIAKQGDCIKTKNSHINETTGNQKGTVSIAGGTHNLYAACDGIDAAYNVLIEDSTTVLNIYTDTYSEYSETVTTVTESTYYIRYSSQNYKYSVKYFNSDTDYVWVNPEYSTSVQSGNRTYYYYAFAKNTNYSKMTVYMYSSSQTQGQSTDYYYCSESLSHNDSYDTIALSSRQGSLSCSWTTYSTSSSGNTGGMGGMGGGMSEGNSDKGTYSTKGIKAANDITINAGTIYVQAYDDAIHAGDGDLIDAGTALENGEVPTGNLAINGGVVTAYSHDDGIHAEGTLTITAGNVSVTKSYEGLEGSFIIVKGGNVSVISSDDGFNGTSTSGAAIEISGGNIYVYACGDGIDSNSTTSKGAILFSGGNVVVICNSNGNAAIDSDGGYTHSGGSVIAIMATGGMTSETTNGNASGMTTKSSLSLSNGGYLTVTVSSTTVATVQMPCSMTAFVVYLGSSSATIASASSSSATLDANGVCWN